MNKFLLIFLHCLRRFLRSVAMVCFLFIDENIISSKVDVYINNFLQNATVTFARSDILSIFRKTLNFNEKKNRSNKDVVSSRKIANFLTK